MVNIPEEGRAVLYGGGILGSTWILVENAWFAQSDGLLSRLFESATVVVTPIQLYMAVLGVWVGLVGVWALDTYKKRLVFAPLLFGGTVLYATDIEKLVTGISLESALVFVAAAGAVAQSSGIPLYRFLKGEISSPVPFSSPVELPAAPRGFFWLLVGFVGVGLVDMHVDPGPPTVFEWHQTSAVTVLAGVLLVGFFQRVTAYEAEQRIIQLGPARAGKTTMMGGLYADASETTTESTELERIRTRIRNERELPTNRTANGELVKFSYLSKNRIFTEKRTVTGFDHEGELLTGRSESGTIRDKIRTHNADTAGSTPAHVQIFRWFKGLFPSSAWDTGVEKLSEANNLEDRRDALAYLVEGADLVLFTVPLDDFLGPIIERGQERSYFRALRVTRGNKEGTYEMTLPAHPNERKYKRDDIEGNEAYSLVREDGQLKYADDRTECDRLSFESFDDLRLVDDDTAYYIPGRSGREHPNEYEVEYQELLNEFEPGLSKSFAWVVTMSDLAYDDYEEIYNEVSQPSDDEDEDEIHDAIADGRSVDGAFETDFPAVVKNRNAFGYELFAKWVQQEYISHGWQGFCDDQGMLADSTEKLVYPVWFDVDAEASTAEALELHSGDRVLVGSDKVLERLERRTHGTFDSIDTCYQALQVCKNIMEDETG